MTDDNRAAPPKEPELLTEPARHQDLSWFELLLDDAGPSQLVAFRDSLVEQGSSSPDGADEQLDRALRLAELLDQRRRKATALAALNGIANQLAAVTEVDQLLQQVVAHAKDLLRVDIAYVSLIDGDQITIEVTSGDISSGLHGLVMSVDEGFASAVIRNRAPLWTKDYREDRRFTHHNMADSAASQEGIRGMLGVPMFSPNGISGVLFAGKRQERLFSIDEIELLTSLGAYASAALESSRLLARQRQAADQLRDANARLEALSGWDRALMQVVLRGGDAVALIREIARLAEVPVDFFRRDGGLDTTAATGLQEASVAELLAVAAQSEAHVHLRVDEGAFVAVPVLATGDMYGVLVARGSAGGGDGDTALILERAAPLMALVLLGQHSAAEALRKTRDALLVDLLTRPTLEDREATVQARLLGIDPTRAYSVVVALPTDRKLSGAQAPIGLRLPPGSVTGTHGHRVVAIIPIADAETIARSCFDRATLAATVGISRSTNDVTKFRECFREAAQTVDVMLTLGRGGEIGSDAELGIYRILLSQEGRQEVSKMFDQHLGALRREEERSGVLLVDTLDCFLRNNQRHAPTAAELNIHVNTLYQRLDKITKVLGERWRDAEVALDLQVVLRLKRSSAQMNLPH